MHARARRHVPLVAGRRARPRRGARGRHRCRSSVSGVSGYDPQPTPGSRSTPRSRSSPRSSPCSRRAVPRRRAGARPPAGGRVRGRGCRDVRLRLVPLLGRRAPDGGAKPGRRLAAELAAAALIAAAPFVSPGSRHDGIARSRRPAIGVLVAHRVSLGVSVRWRAAALPLADAEGESDRRLSTLAYALLAVLSARRCSRLRAPLPAARARSRPLDRAGAHARRLRRPSLRAHRRSHEPAPRRLPPAACLRRPARRRLAGDRVRGVRPCRRRGARACRARHPRRPGAVPLRDLHAREHARGWSVARASCCRG